MELAYNLERMEINVFAELNRLSVNHLETLNKKLPEDERFIYMAGKRRFVDKEKFYASMPLKKV